jgi:putative tryptophan/tyrosine transport system substrate-binding protein
VSAGLAGSLAAKAATSTIPIIFVGIGDPVVAGVVPRLAQPGGNVTGVTNIPDHAFLGKHLELLKEAVPGLTRAALLLYMLDPFHARRIPPVETAAKTLGVHLYPVYVEAPQDFEAAFSAMRRRGGRRPAGVLHAVLSRAPRPDCGLDGQKPAAGHRQQ